MNTEIELKLAVTPQALPLLQQYLNQFNLLENKTVFLKNTYYDYPDNFLAQQKMGLRVRCENDQRTLTLKTDGDVRGGLHLRPEYDLPLAENESPTTERLNTLYPFRDLPQAPLIPIFSTNFDRTLWRIQFERAQIEAAFDQGKIISNNKTQPICEIEFELKTGSLDELFRFVADLPFERDIYFSGASKALRGYRLSEGDKAGSAFDWPTIWRRFLATENAENRQSAVDFREKSACLLKIEQQLIEETLSKPTALLASNFVQTVEQVGAFFNLYHYYVENIELWEKGLMSVNQVENELAAQTILPSLAASHRALQEEIKALIRFHSESRDNVQTIEKLRALLTDRDYMMRMINLMRLTLIK